MYLYLLMDSAINLELNGRTNLDWATTLMDPRPRSNEERSHSGKLP